jgi:cell division protein FtsB
MGTSGIPTYLKSVWREIIIIALLIGFAFTYWNNNNTITQLKTQIESARAQKTKDDINKPSDVVKDRDANLYPKLDADMAKLNKSVNDLKATLKGLEKNKPTKGQSYEIFKNKTASEVSTYFTNSGYANTTTTSPSTK